MKRLIPAVAIVLAWASASSAAAPAPLTTLSAILALSNDESAKKLPVAFEATVTYYRGYEQTLFLQDGDAGIYAYFPGDLKLIPGDRILVRGKTQNSFNPIVIGDSVTLLGRVALPKPSPATFTQMIGAQTDCRLVTVRGVIRSADFMPAVHFANLQLLTDGGYFDATVDGDQAIALVGMLDAEVELTGVASENFDSKMQVTGILLHIQSFANIKLLHRAGANPWSLPATPMDRILAVYHVSDATQRVRVHGIITYYEPGVAVILQNDDKSIWISTRSRSYLRVGDIADATGFPDAHDGFLNLAHGEVRDTLNPAPVTPLAETWETLTPRGNAAMGHHYDLVSIEGRVVTQFHEASQDEYVLSTGGKQFSAIYRHLDGLPPHIKQVPIGSRIRVTGICVLEASNPFIAQVPFNILMRSFDDIAIVANPSPLNIRNLVLVVLLLLMGVAGVGGWGWSLERKIRRQTAVLSARTEAEAELERQRSRILEDINGTLPLAEILDEITAMVSSSLHGAPCWCVAADGAVVGVCPVNSQSLRIASAEIPARSGPALGTLFAGFDPQAPPLDREAEALHNGTRLATLAIETRRLYSDLRRRSEFDLLTDIPNRFAMERFIDARIEEARNSGGILGLIYIDLDKFKPINDTHGHHIGDLYLQAVALRMSRQLLGSDLLARLGGDEFGALVSLHNGRSDLDKIAARLAHCFDEPFAVEGIVLHGQASIGVALYPEDGLTKDSLLSAADAAMYDMKNSKKNFEKAWRR